jgi:pimeloyl-ACP methyl ester carboxylesterase
MIRTVAAVAGGIAVIPVGWLLILLPTTPITPSGALYLGASVLIVIGALTAPLRTKRARGVCRVGILALVLLIAVRLAVPARGVTTSLIVLPTNGGVRLLNRLFDEQDIALFGERIALRLGALVSPREDEQLVATLYRHYAAMRQEDVTPLSPFLSTTLAQQQSERFDTIVVAPPQSVEPHGGVIFLHGFGGNFTLQCWLFAHALQPSGITTFCPSTSWRADWWSEQGKATVSQAFAEMRRRGITRIYLAGLSNGGVGVSRLAQELSEQISGLVLISGVDPDGQIPSLPILIIQGVQDERMPAALAQRYAAAAGSRATLHALPGDHFVLAKRADEVQQIIAAWFAEQEAGARQP